MAAWLTSTPVSISSLTISRCPPPAARMKAVYPSCGQEGAGENSHSGRGRGRGRREEAPARIRRLTAQAAAAP